MNDRAEAFHRLHASGCFVLPNPWDRGSAHVLQQLGFPALATTSSGLAWSLGRPDNSLPIEQVLSHLSAIVDAVGVPVNADFEGGFAVEPSGVAANVARAIATGVAGLSIEDSTGEAERPLFDFTLSVERIRAAREAIDASGRRTVLTGRSEGFIVGRPDLEQTIAHLKAYAEAGADCVYAPGIRTREQIVAVVNAVAPTPVNVLLGGPFATVQELAEMGVRRISVGGALARTAWTGFLAAATELAEQGRATQLGPAISHAQLNTRFHG